MKPVITAERLREVLSYDPHSGRFSRRVRQPGASVGDIAGSDNGDGYVTISVDGRIYKAHRLAWLHVTGEWPADQIDHVNGDRSDNRFANLRPASNALNVTNQHRAHRNNRSSDLLGVSFRKDCGRWTAHISVKGVKRYLGRFDTAEAAHEAYVAAKRALHPFAAIGGTP